MTPEPTTQSPHLPPAETLTVEFKSDRKRLSDTDLVEALVGLANTEGGELWLGVDDDGEAQEPLTPALSPKGRGSKIQKG